jgi:hypothetical protein
MACVGICETFPNMGKTGYHVGIQFCSKCNPFMYSDNVFCLCCSGNLRVGPMTNERDLKGRSKPLYFKSLLGTCQYKLVRIRHATGEPNPSGLPTHDSPVFDLTSKRSGQIIPLL